jgi:thiamine pyrophosphokinase
MIGTSNEVAEGPVQLRLDGPGMLAILPRGRLDAALTGLLGAVA